MAKTDAQIGLRVTKEFKEQLEAQAQKERRSVSNLILKVMEDYLKEQQEKPSDRALAGGIGVEYNGKNARLPGAQKEEPPWRNTAHRLASAPPRSLKRPWRSRLNRKK